MSQHQLTIEEPVGLQNLQRFGLKYFIKVTGNPCGVHKEILNHLHKQIPGLRKMNEINDCDVILVFCPIVSRAGTDIQSALSELNECSESKPAVFMVLHHTFEREKILPDSSRCINRKNTLTVNLLFNEDDGIMTCDTNHKALTKIIKQFQPQKWFMDNYICSDLSYVFSWKIVVVILIFGACLLYYRTIEQDVISQDNTGILEEAEKPNTVPLRTFSSENADVCRIPPTFWETEQNNSIQTILTMAKQDSRDCLTRRDVKAPAEGTSLPSKIAGNKYYVLIPEKTLKCHEDIISFLKQMPGVEEVKSVTECDVIVVFCTVVSRAGTNIEAALNKLNTLSDSKPAIFMVFHHTFDPEKTVLDSSRCVNRTDTLTVDLLFEEDKGLLACVKNTEAQDRILKWLQPQVTGDWRSYFWRWRCWPTQNPEEQQEKVLASSHANEPDQTVASELVICLLGISGSGKTAGNFILGKEERYNVSLPTQEITVERGTVDGDQMYVIFTPDWFSSLEEMKQIIQTCSRFGLGGPYAFLLVIPLKQLSENEKIMLDYMEKSFEENSWKRVMILFTITDELENQNTMFIQQDNLKSLMEKCGNRSKFLNTNQIGNSTQVPELLKYIKEMAGGKRESSDVSERSEIHFEQNTEEDFVILNH